MTSDLESERSRIETLEHSAKETAKIISSKENEISQLTEQLNRAEEFNNR